MRRSMILYLGAVVLVAPHMTAGVADVLACLLVAAAFVLMWLGD